MTDVKSIVDIILLLPKAATLGAAGVRDQAAKLLVRYLGGRPSLVDEVCALRGVQEVLAATVPLMGLLRQTAGNRPLTDRKLGVSVSVGADVGLLQASGSDSAPATAICPDASRPEDPRRVCGQAVHKGACLPFAVRSPPDDGARSLTQHVASARASRKRSRSEIESTCARVVENPATVAKPAHASCVGKFAAPQT